MTRRLYYQDAYATSFSGKVVERLRHEGELAVILDQTCFYPTSGGQPADRGHLNGQPVTDVFVRAEDGAVVHVIASEVWQDEVTGKIAWSRRFDHMQQHTGQHILSQAFIQVAEARTVGFHLSENSVTIDLNHTDLAPAQVKQAELLANRIVWENRPVNVRMVTREQAQKLPLRKIPAIGDGHRYRLIEIEQFDLNACGGTHVSHTGAVGLIKLLKLERRGDSTRVEFACGQRALADYQQKHALVSRLATSFTTGYWNLEEVIENLRQEVKDNGRLVQQQATRLLAYEGQALLADATPAGGARIVTAVFEERAGEELRILANQLIAEPGVVALLGLAGAKTRLLFARAEDAPGDMSSLLKQALPVLGNAGGGGSESFAQGGGPAAAPERVRQALKRAEKLLLAQL